MTSAGAANEDDGYLSSMRVSRKSPAVLKHGLILLKAEAEGGAILVFEGVDDKVVYHHWINRICSDLLYEPYVCEGKKYVLQLLEVVNNDVNGLGDGVYFFVDKDFDDIEEHPVCSSLYITSAYSIENYLVDPHTVRELLKTHFHCDFGPVRRGEIMGLYTRLYKDFLDISEGVNFRTYSARKLGIEAVLPQKISRIADISLTSVSSVGLAANESVRLIRELTVEEVNGLSSKFEKLDKAWSYRGKYAFMFFTKWIDLAVRDRNSDGASILFDKIKVKSKVAPVSLDCIASRSPIPRCLHGFIRGINMRASSI